MNSVYTQYADIKQSFPSQIILIKVGDFYETFEDDARIVSEVCNMALTSRALEAGRVPLTAIPAHSATDYLIMLTKAGHNFILAVWNKA